MAYLDVLGFTKLVEEKGLEEIYKIYEALIEKVNLVVEHYRAGGFSVPVLISETATKKAYFPEFEIEYAYASDSISVWCEFNNFHIVSFLECINILFCSALEIEIPLRGIITFGEAIMSKSKSIYIGKPIIEGVNCEKLQAWMGVTFGKALIDNVKYGWLGNLKNVIPYEEHIKKTDEGIDYNAKYGIANIVIDWPRFIRKKGNSQIILQWLETQSRDSSLSPSVRGYYEQTIKFFEYSRDNSNWYDYFPFIQSRVGGFIYDETKNVYRIYNSSEKEWYENNTAGLILVKTLPQKGKLMTKFLKFLASFNKKSKKYFP